MTDFLHCVESWEPSYLIFTSFAPSLLYYSHIPTAIVALIIGVFVFVKNRHLFVAKILFFLSVMFSIWSFASLITWVNDSSQIIMFAWSFIGLISAIISISSVYFFYVLVKKRDVSFISKFFWAILLLPIIFLMPTELNLSGFDISYCQANEGLSYNGYYYFLGLLAFISIIFIAFSTYKKSDLNNKKQVVLALIGTELFLLSFFFAGFLATYLVDAGYVSDFGLEQYGLFGMVIFMSFLAYLIVRFKAFNIKLLAAQALIVALIVLIGAEFFFVESRVNYILVAVTFVVASSLGIVLIRSVRKVDYQKELLEVANEEQENLIHFISHQVKGYFTKSRNIFSTLSDGESNLPKDLIPFINEGLRSDEEGVQVVQNILNAANLKTGKIKFEKSRFDISALVTEVVRDNTQSARDKGLTLDLQTGGKPVEVAADKSRLHDAITNLVQNAIHYTQKGSIKVTLDTNAERGRAGTEARISVSDTGIGLTRDDRKKLFTSGGRGAESLQYNVNSTGYGLFIAKKVVEAHGGDITAHSAGRGKGSTFVLNLPLS